MAILRNHLPPQAVGWVYDYLDDHKIHFHITRRRTSKLGDYRRPYASHPYHEISINGDLMPDYFFWVFLHEAAHLETYLKYRRVQPHGHEWQEEYRTLIVRHISLFPANVQPLLHRLVSRIPLNRSLMRQIESLLADKGDSDNGLLHLDDLPAGSRFRLSNHPDREFISEVRRRTRWLCREISTGRHYTISATAEVQPCIE